MVVGEGLYLESAGELSDEEGEEKLERIDVEEDHEEQRGIRPDGDDVVQAVAAEEAEVGPPDRDKEKKQTANGMKPQQDGVELVVGLGDLERDDDEGEGEAEDDVGEAVDARHVGAAQAEAVLGDVVVECGHRWDSVARSS